jgi:hypothetical protein
VVALALYGVCFFMGYRHGETVTGNHFKAVIAQNAENEAKQRAALEAKARDTEQHAADAMARIDEQHQKAIENEKAKADAVIAAYGAGTVRLRNRFTCPATGTGGNMSAAATSTGQRDERTQGGLQQQDVQFLVRFAAEADELADQLSACQSIIKADRAGAKGASKP